MSLKDIVKQYKHCVICGSTLTPLEQRILLCKTCNQHTYVSPTPCCAIVIQNNVGEIMLVKRKLEPKKDFWDLPGGFVDLEESFEEATIRESKEELGVDVINLKYITSEFDTYTFEDFTFPTLGVIFTGELGHQSPTANDDVSEIVYFAPNKIPFEKIAFKSITRALEKFTETHR